MKVISAFITIQACIFSILAISMEVQAENLSEDRSAWGYYVNLKNPDVHQRELDVLNTLKQIFPEIGLNSIDSLVVFAQIGNDSSGYVVVVRQVYRKCSVEGSHIWLRVLKNGYTTWAGVNMQTGINLSNKSYLNKVYYPDSLIIEGESLCPDVDSVLFSAPTIFATPGGQYKYALWVVPIVGNPRLIDWETGEILAEREPESDMAGSVQIEHYLRCPPGTSGCNEIEGPVISPTPRLGDAILRDDGEVFAYNVVDVNGNWQHLCDNHNGVQLEISPSLVLPQWDERAHIGIFPCTSSPDESDWPFSNYYAYLGPVNCDEPNALAHTYTSTSRPGSEPEHPNILWHAGTFSDSMYVKYNWHHRVRAHASLYSNVNGQSWYYGWLPDWNPAHEYQIFTGMDFGLLNGIHWGLWRDLIIHEWAHTCHASLRSGGIGRPWTNPSGCYGGPSGTEGCAVGETMADVLACFATGDPVHMPVGRSLLWDVGGDPRRYDDYNPEEDMHTRALVLGRAFWDLRYTLWLSGNFTSVWRAFDYALELAFVTPSMGPTGIREWAWKCMLYDDDDGNIATPSPNGAAICKAFWGDDVSEPTTAHNHWDRHIAARMDWIDDIDAFELYLDNPETFVGFEPCTDCGLESVDIGATSPSNTSKFLESRYGNHAVWTDNGHVKYAWQPKQLFEGFGEWRVYTVSSASYGEASPTLAIGGRYPGFQTTQDALFTDGVYVYICWKEGSDQIKFLRHSIIQDPAHYFRAPGEEQFIPYYYSWEWINTPNLPQGLGVEYSAPSIAAQGYHTTLFVGVSGSNDDGVHYLQWNKHADDSYPVDHDVIPFSEGADIASVCAYVRAEQSDPIVVWSTGEEVHTAMGGGMGTYTWPVNRHFELSQDLTGLDHFQQVSVVSADITDGSTTFPAFVAVWEARNVQTWSQELIAKKGYIDPQNWNMYWSPAFDRFSLGPCGYVTSPSMTAVRDSHAVETSMAFPAVYLAYQNEFDWDPVPYVGYRGLCFEDASFNEWYWSIDNWTEHGYSPSIGSKSFSNSFPYFPVEFLTGHSSTPSRPLQIRQAFADCEYDNPHGPAASVLTLVNDVAWKSPITLNQSVRIPDGITLTIGPILCDPEAESPAFSTMPGVQIIVENGGMLYVDGTAQDSIEMVGADGAYFWSGIKVEPGGSLRMNYVEMKDCDSVCLYTDKPASVNISNCTFRGNKMLGNRGTVRLTNGPSVTQNMSNSTITAEAAEGYGLYAYNCKVKLTNVTVENCEKTNSAFLAVTGDVRNCTFKDRTDKYGVLFSSAGTTPNFTCCSFENIAPVDGLSNSTIYAAMGSAPTFGFEGISSDVSNTFKDTSAYILKMYGKGVVPVIDNPTGNGAGGKNDWYQYKSNGKYLYWGSPYPNPLTVYLAKEQYWNNSPVDVKDFEPSSTSYFALGSGETNPWGPCGGSAASHDPGDGRAISALDDVPSVYDTLFAEAVSLEAHEEYQDAQNIFRTIATSAEGYQLVWQATTHVVSTQRALDAEAGEVWIPELIDSLILADSSEYSTFVYANRLLSTYRLAREEYTEAITICTDLLNGELTDVDSILVSIDLLGIQMAAGLVEYGGGLDEASYSLIPQSLRCSSMSDAMSRQMALLDALGEANSDNEPMVQVAIPTEFRLYQNYPNPFNPTTQIEFDLPEAVHVTLRVFNTLGQEVATVNDAMYPAGHHVATWNGKSNAGADVATGLYVYQIQAGNFTDTKKMILMR